MFGKMSNIIQVCEFEWFKWVMFWDETGAYPNNQFRFGKYLGLSIDIGTALMVKIITEIDHVLHRSAYQALTQEEWEYEECKNECSSFMESLNQVMGPQMRLRDFVDLGVEETPQIDPSENKSQNADMFPILDEEP